MDSVVPTNHEVKLKESEKSNEFPDPVRELKKLWTWKWSFSQLCSWYSHQRIDTGTGGLGNKRKNGDHPNYSIVQMGQNTEKSPGTWGDLLSLKLRGKPSANADVKTSLRVK